MIDAVVVETRNRALLDWYQDHHRSLPWRDVGDPYLTLVSEMMLQQTQVDRVVPRFERFIVRWPTVELLAEAERVEVLAEWSGLGYNARAVRLHDAARVISVSGWPTTPEGLRQLPGVGPYTSAAIASIAFDSHTAAIDTNVRRVLSRWIGVALDGRDLVDVATALLDVPAGNWNQAVMDLGASLCRPRDPSCGSCPVSHWCADPRIYEAPAKQGTFKGSNRELRGALVRAHVQGDDLWDTGRALGRIDEDIARTLEGLAREGLITGTHAIEWTG